MPKVKESRIRHIYSNAKFNNYSVFLAFIVLFGITILVVTIKENLIAISFALLILLIFLFSLMIDIQGVEVDKKNQKIRNYRKIFWIKNGKWLDFKKYKTVQLSKERMAVPISIMRDSGAEIFYYFFIKFIDDESKSEIVIRDFNNYKKAKTFAVELANEFNLSFSNITMSKKSKYEEVWL